MPSTPEEKEFTCYVVDLMQSIGPVHSKAMFGGYGIFLEGLMFGLIADGILYLKADKKTENEFIAKGLEKFAYYKQGKEVKLSYFQAPEEVLDDAEEMAYWASNAYNTALRAVSKKRTKRQKTK